MKTLIKTTCWALMVLLALPALAQEFQEGSDYRRLRSPVPTSAGEGQVEVVELFWYGCPHCYRLEPAMERWLEDKPDHIKFVRLPAVLNANWELGARAYYTARELGILDEIHQPLFDAIHRERRPMGTVDDLAAFFADYGVDREAFDKAWKSFGVETQVRKATKRVRDYGVFGVPTLIVGGEYETSLSMAGSEQRLFDIVEFLAQRELQGQG